MNASPCRQDGAPALISPHVVIWLCVLAALAGAVVQFTFGQEVGDVIAVERETPLRLPGKTVATLRPGYAAIVEKVQGDWLWISEPMSGWISRKDVSLLRLDQTYRSSRGLTVRYPREWTLLSPERWEQSPEEVLREAPWAATLPWDELEFLLLGPGSHMPAAVQASVMDGPLGNIEPFMVEFAAALQEGYATLDPQIRSVGVATAAGRDAGSIEFQFTRLQDGQRLQMQTLLIPWDRGQHVEVGSLTQADEFAWYAPVFQRIAADLRLPEE